MTKYITVHDATYAYSQIGQGEPLVLLHGFTGRKETWNQIVSYLSHSFQVITIDLPGHGQTVSNKPRTMEQFAKDLDEIVNRLNLGSIHLLGYSLGGRSALSYAMYFPGNIRTLILESASPGIRTKEEQKQRMKQDALLAQKLIMEGIDEFVTYWENIPLFQTQKRLPIELQQAVRTERLSQNVEGLALSLLHMGTGMQPSWWGRLSELTVPVTLIVGEEDEKFVCINNIMQTKLKFATVKIVENAGHAVHLEQVEKFVTIVEEHMIKYKTGVSTHAKKGANCPEK